MKIWSLFYHETMRTGNTIMWKRGEIAPKEQFLLFSTIFSEYSIFTSQITYSFVKCGCLIYLFFSSILQLCYVEIRISRCISESPLDFEITRVDCIYEWELRSRGETYIHDTFYETHSILHFNWKWESELKSDIQDTSTDCTHLTTTIPHQCCVLVILMHEIFLKENVTKWNSKYFEHIINLVVFGVG